MSFKRLLSRTAQENDDVDAGKSSTCPGTTSRLKFESESKYELEKGVVDLTHPGFDVKPFKKIFGKQPVQKLKLFSNQLPKIPSEISKLASSLEELRVIRHTQEDGKGINKLPNEIGKLTCLSVLDLRGNPFGEVPAQVLQINQLTVLVLSNCAVGNIPTNINQLARLNKLDLSSNSLSSLPEELFDLRQLEYLVLSSNQLTLISTSIENLKDLKRLSVSENKLGIFPPGICKLKKLVKLYMRNNLIVTIPDKIGNMVSLTFLDLASNCLSAIPESISKLQSLTYLNLADNNLTYLPRSITNLNMNDDALLLGRNPIQKPPLEVCVEGMESIRGYFQAMDESLDVHSKRLKLVLLGETMAGKTSLARSLVDCRDPNVKADDRTVGLDYYLWKVQPHVDSLEILMVDCAGQRKYLLTHQFFITEGALFVLVVDLSSYVMSQECYRKTIGDWVDLVLARVPGAVILVVPTHLDLLIKREQEVISKCEHIIDCIHKDEKDRICAINAEIGKLEERLEESEFTQEVQQELHQQLYELKTLIDWRPYLATLLKFGNINSKIHTSDRGTELSMIPVSCKGALEGMINLRNEIVGITKNKKLCPNVDRDLPKSWINLEWECRSLNNDKHVPVISKSELADIAAQEFSLDGQMFTSALGYLNSIGALAHFRHVKRAEHLVFLKPTWLVYLLQLLFRHDHKDNLQFRDEFVKYGMMEGQFYQDKEDLLQNGYLSQGLLRCMWNDLKMDDHLYYRIISILEHFSLICQLPKTTNDPPTLLIPWFLKDSIPKAVCQLWTKELSDEKDLIVARIDIPVACLPAGLFERFLIDTHTITCNCIPWKNGLLISEPKIMVLCSVMNQRNSSIVLVEGKHRPGCKSDLWRLMLILLKALKNLIHEWPGISCFQTYSICPECSKDTAQDKPYLFHLNWFDENLSSKKTFMCKRCFTHVDGDNLRPPKDVLMSVINWQHEPDGAPRDITSEISSIELSKVADMIGSHYREMGRHLGLTEANLDSLEDEWPHNYHEKVMGIFKKWKQMRGRKADRSHLILAMENVHPVQGEILDFLKKR